MDRIRFLGVCILGGLLCVAGAIIWHTNITAEVGRFQLVMDNTRDARGLLVIDTKTGEVQGNNHLVIMTEFTQNDKKQRP